MSLVSSTRKRKTKCQKERTCLRRRNTKNNWKEIKLTYWITLIPRSINSWSKWNTHMGQSETYLLIKTAFYSCIMALPSLSYMTCWLKNMCDCFMSIRQSYTSKTSSHCLQLVNTSNLLIMSAFNLIRNWCRSKCLSTNTFNQWFKSLYHQSRHIWLQKSS